MNMGDKTKEAYNRIRDMRDLLDGIIEDIEEGRTDFGICVRSVALVLGQLPVPKIEGRAVPRLRIVHRKMKDGRTSALEE